jgi:hypothetical protein
MAPFFTQAVPAADNRHELYVYLRGRLIYKAWYLAGQKQYSCVFHMGEGRSQATKASRSKEESK